MENTSTDNTVAAEGIADNATTSTLENNQTQAPVDPLKNLKGEFNRKMSKMEQKLDAVLNAFNTNNTQRVSQPADEAVKVDTDVKQYVDAIVTQQHQKTAFEEAVSMFPELDPESDSYDEKFYKAVDAEFSTNQRKDPKGPLKAAKLVALEMGKIEQLTRTSLLKDEARRSRILGEGSIAPKEAKKNKEPVGSEYANNLAKLGINLEKLNKRIKANKDKYEGL